MADFDLSKHAEQMLAERKILQEWVWHTLKAPSLLWEGLDDNLLHYAAPIAEKDGRILHVVVNPHVAPRRIVTVFFDRRLRR